MNIYLVNPRYVKNVPGKKTDKKDSEWLIKLFLSGLLENSFVPQQDIRNIRDLIRYYRKITNHRTQEKNRLHKQLQDANIKLSSVLSDIFGTTGLKIIKAISEGIVDVDSLILLKHGRVRATDEELRAALTGKIKYHHCMMIKIHLQNIHYYETLQEKINEEIDLILKKKYLKYYQKLQTIPGVSQKIARSIIGEIGYDMSNFPTMHHLASWAGICPGNNISGGRTYSARARPGNRSLKTTLVEAAWAAVATKGSTFRDKYYKMTARMGKKKALFAIAHKLLKTIYVVLESDQNYKPIPYR